MTRILLQAFLLVTVGGLGLVPLIRPPVAVRVERVTVSPAPRSGWTIDAVDGRARRTRIIDGIPIESEARIGPLNGPTVFEVLEGELRLTDGEVALAADEGARFFVGNEGLGLDFGRLRVDGPRALTVAAAGARIEGQRFGLWRTPAGLHLAALAPVEVDGQGLAAGTGLRFGDEASPLSDVLRLDPEDGPRPGLLQVEVPAHALVFVQRDGVLVPRRPVDGRLLLAQGVTPLLRDALGRWAVPGRPSRSLGDLAEVFPAAADRGVLDRLGQQAAEAVSDDAAVEGTRAEPAPAAPRRRPRPRALREAPAPAPAETSDGEGRDPPDSLQVDWTQLGRPSGSVLDGSKQEAPAPGAEPR